MVSGYRGFVILESEFFEVTASNILHKMLFFVAKVSILLAHERLSSCCTFKELLP